MRNGWLAGLAALVVLVCTGCETDPHPSPEQRMQGDLLWLSTREFMSLEVTGSFGTPLEKLPPRGDPPTTTVQMLWTGPSGWVARASITGHAGDCVMAGGLIPRSAFAFTTLRHKGADPEDVVCDNSRGAGSADWGGYVQRYVSLPLDHALRFFASSRASGRPVSADSAVQPRYLEFSGLHRELLWSDDRSWAARTWLDSMPDGSCVVWWGALGARVPPATKAGSVARAPGVIVCDTIGSPGQARVGLG